MVMCILTSMKLVMGLRVPTSTIMMFTVGMLAAVMRTIKHTVVILMDMELLLLITGIIIPNAERLSE